MENLLTNFGSFQGCCGDNWSVSCNSLNFAINHNGIKMYAKREESIKKITFDLETKIVEITIEKSILPQNTPRCVDLSDTPYFFEELREDIEKVLQYGGYSRIIPNKDRTIFEIE